MICTYYEVKYTFRDFIFFHDFTNDTLQSNGAKGCFWAWLPYRNVPANRSDHGIPRPNSDRKIESGNYTNNPEWMVLIVHTVTRTFRMHGRTVELSGKAYGKITNVDHLLNFTQTFLINFPHFPGD